VDRSPTLGRANPKSEAVRRAAARQLRRGLVRWYLAEHPAREAVRVAILQQVSHRCATDVFRVTLRYEEAGARGKDELTLRVYAGAEAAARARREFQALGRLANAGYPVPQVGRLLLEPSPFERPVITTERTSGRSLASAITETDGDHRGHWRLFCRLLVELHALDWRPFVAGAADREPRASSIAWLAQLRETIDRRELQALGPVLEWLDDRRTSVPSERLSVVHGDFRPEHVLVRRDGGAVVTDWTHVDVADARFDLAWTLLRVGIAGNPARRRLVLDEYQRQAGRRIEDLDFFEVAAGLRYLAGCLGLPTAPAASGGQEASGDPRRQLPRLRAVYSLVRARTGLRLRDIARRLALPE
jgi:aminoglycoside phosphotransferase (APT) family kinase protein